MRNRFPHPGMNKARENCGEFQLAELGRNCWLIACNGRPIAGAVLSSFRAAADYAAALAEASGAAMFRMTVTSAPHRAPHRSFQRQKLPVPV